MKHLLAVLLISIAAHASTVYLTATGAATNGTCFADTPGKAACAIDTMEGGDYGLMHATGSVSATESLDAVQISSRTEIGAGEIAWASAAISSQHTLFGGSGAGFAEVLISWSLNVYNSWEPWGEADLDGQRITFEQFSANNTGSDWSDPIPMTWGQPFSYNLSVLGGFSNGFGDCCGGMNISLAVTDWRGSSDSTGFARLSAVPEPSTLLLCGIGIAVAIFARLKKRAA